MDTKTEVKAASAWTADENAVISFLHEKRGMTRGNAIRKMKNDMRAMQMDAAGLLAVLTEDKPLDKALHALVKESKTKKVAKPKAAKPAKTEREDRTSLSAQKMTAIRKAATEQLGKGRELMRVVKSSISPNFAQYVWIGVDNGTVISVNPDSLETRWLAPDSKSVKTWQRALARMEKLAEKRAAAAKADKA